MQANAGLLEEASSQKKDLQSRATQWGRQALLTHVRAIDYVPLSHYPAVKRFKLSNSQVKERRKE
jgi:hypothetical protein